jgi:hypothetical protein
MPEVDLCEEVGLGKTHLLEFRSTPVLSPQEIAAWKWVLKQQLR